MFARLAQTGRALAQGLVQLVYPGFCQACGQPLSPEQRHFCDACRSELTVDPHPSCPRCASTVGPFTNLDAGCPHCRQSVFHFESAQRLRPYDGLLRELVLRMKQPAGAELAECLGELWAEYAEARLRELRADLVVPVPLHWRQRWSRGHNQSEALACALAERLRLPCRPRCLRRTRHTPRQALQTPAARWVNVKGAFQARLSSLLKDRTVLLVDDVLTTGATASEAGRALRAAGAARVHVAVLAAHSPS